MNEQIKAIGRQAGLVFIEDGVYGQRWYSGKSGLGASEYEKLVELLASEAFRAGLLYAAKKYESVREDRFIGADVAMFLEMEANELTDKEIAEHFGVKE